jgi:mono/diheme cytochrome c family protein
MLGVGALAGLFIVFAALSAFYFPRRNPDFPGNRLGLFTLVTVLLFVGTMAGMFVFAKEESHGATKGEHAAADSGPTTTEEHATTTTPAAGGATGDPVAGKAVFTSAGCGACHTLAAAGASGNVGPNLDEAKPDFELVVERVTNGKGAMPSFKGSLDEKQIHDVAAFVVQSTQG